MDSGQQASGGCQCHRGGVHGGELEGGSRLGGGLVAMVVALDMSDR
jgi:hypothetical protein